MTGVERALKSYLRPPTFTADDLQQGGRFKPPTFSEQLESTRQRSRVGFWICAGMVLLLFLVVLLRTYESFGQLTQLTTGTVTSIFGVSASGAVVMMIRLSREAARADVLLILLNELRVRDPDGFTRLLTDLCKKWYGLK